MRSWTDLNAAYKLILVHLTEPALKLQNSGGVCKSLLYFPFTFEGWKNNSIWCCRRPYLDLHGLSTQISQHLSRNSRTPKKSLRVKRYSLWLSENQYSVCLGSTVVAKIIRTPRVFPLNPIVNKSCKIGCCGNKMYQIIQNMTLSQSLEFKSNLL